MTGVSDEAENVCFTVKEFDMAEVARSDNHGVKPAVQCKAANRDLLMKNSRASEKWFRLRNALDKEKKEFESKINVDRNVLLKQRERLQSTPTMLKIAPEMTGNQGRDTMPRRMTVADVYGALMKAVKDEKQNQNADHRNVQSEPHRSRGSTLSFDNKKATRKPAHFSLQSLQRAQNSFQLKLKATAQEREYREKEETVDDVMLHPGPFDLNEEEKSLGPKLRLPPTSLPPIRNQTKFQPRARNFEKRRLQSCPDSCEVDEVKYCRYLRVRRNSVPSVRPGMSLKYDSFHKP